MPRAALGLDKTAEPLSFGFKWCDNTLTDGDIMTLYTEGDAAPGARFTFAFTSDAKAAEPGNNGTDDNTASKTKTKTDADKVWNTVLIVLCIAAAVAAVAAAVIVVMKRKKAD